jgi:DNA-directed RNA polymerase subunit RPC12/RpoP
MVVFQCTACHKDLRAVNKDQGKCAKCPCGRDVWVPGESMGLWLNLLDALLEGKNWNCPACNMKAPISDAACPHCKKEFPLLVKG